MTDCPCCSPREPSPPLTRRQVLLGGAAAGALVVLGRPSGAWPAAPGRGAGSGPALHPAIHPDATRGWDDVHGRGVKHVRPIMHPIAGPSTTLDNYRTAQRPTHVGVDVMADKMVKLLACVSGTVVELRHRATPGGSNGNSLYIRGDDGWYYCYLHINNDRPGTDDGSNLVEHTWGPALRRYATSATTMDEEAARGHRVRKGDHVAYVGDSGNAESAGSHLHLEIRMPAPRVWDAAAVNPQYSLDAAEAAREAVAVPPETFTPWDNSVDLVTRQYRDLLGRDPAPPELAYWADLLDSGSWTPPRFMEHLLTSPECDGQVHAVVRLYQAYLLRRPDHAGFAYWVGRRRSGESLTRISDHFARSSEFTTRYGSLTDEQFVDQIYRNVMDRGPDQAGLAYWQDQLARGRTRGWVMVQFSESSEYRTATGPAVGVMGAYGTLLQRMPSVPDIDYWSGQPVRTLVNEIRLSGAYATVVATP